MFKTCFELNLHFAHTKTNIPYSQSTISAQSKRSIPRWQPHHIGFCIPQRKLPYIGSMSSFVFFFFILYNKKKRKKINGWVLLRCPGGKIKHSTANSDFHSILVYIGVACPMDRRTCWTIVMLIFVFSCVSTESIF